MTYEVCFKGKSEVFDGIYSVNMVEGEEQEVREYAEKYAERFSYIVVCISPLTDWEIRERKAKGMPYKNLNRKGDG